MEQTETNRKGFGWRLVAAALAPLTVASLYLFFSRWPSYRFSAFTDYAGFAVSIIVGVVLVVTLPIPLYQRILSLLLYVPLLAAVLFIYTFLFIAVVFHDGL